MTDQINVTQNERPNQAPPPANRPTGPGIWVVLGVLIGALVVLFLIWAFWLQPSYFPQTQFLVLPQQQAQPAAPTQQQAAPAPQPAAPGAPGGAGGTGQGGAGGAGGTGGTGSGTGGAGGSSTPATTAP